MGDILFLAHRIPYPPDRGDKIRSFHMLKALSAIRPVHLIAFGGDAADFGHEQALAPLVASQTIIRRGKPLWLAGLEGVALGKPASVAAFGSTAMRRAVTRILARHSIDTLFVYSGQMAQYLPASRQCREIMDFVDVDSAKFADYAARGGKAARFMQREARFLARVERAVAHRADATLFVSEAEARLFRARGGQGNIVAVENGIDAAYFDPAASFRPIGYEDALIVFTGQMNYWPNVEAVTRFATNILPLVRNRWPEARFAIVGREPSQAVERLADLPGVRVTGEVEDVRGWLAAAAVVVAPLTIARGVQNKVLEAMAMARPVIASPQAAEGIEHGGAIHVADTDAAFAETISALLSEPLRAQALGNSARAHVLQRYGWERTLAPLRALVGR